MTTHYPRAVLFDLLTALLDSWTLWNDVAGSEQRGRAWRADYLARTYDRGAYVPYEELVRQAAEAVDLPATVADDLERRWTELPVWSGAQEVLSGLAGRTRLGVVTNCSNRLGRLAAARLEVDWDCVVTAEDAGWYKPDPRPYRRALEQLGVEPADAAFVAGSGYDLFGTSRVGLRTYWHNRVGLGLPPGAPPPEVESRTLAEVPVWLEAAWGPGAQDGP
ncbi:MAG: HAD-IA family hydrolase [Microbacteriaceae bacterium]|nr:HAD-IA family hydrolase [Microbacteriaceae bacterium]